MATCDRGFEDSIDRMVLGDLSDGKWAKVRAHLGDCADCRDRYNRAALAERILSGGPAALGRVSEAEVARVGRCLFDGQAGRPRRGLLPRWAIGLAFAGVAAAMIPIFLHARPTPGEFSVRGTAGDPREQAGLRAFCLKARDVAATSLDVKPLIPGAGPSVPQCSAADLLKLAYSNRAGYEDLFLVGVDEHYAIKWYEPRPPSGMSVPAQRAVDQPIGGAIRIGVNHEPGLVRVFALFGHAPIASREVEAAVDELRRSGRPIRDAAALPLDGRSDVVQRSLLLDVTGAVH